MGSCKSKSFTGVIDASKKVKQADKINNGESTENAKEDAENATKDEKDEILRSDAFNSTMNSRKTALTKSRMLDPNYDKIPNKIHRKTTGWDQQTFGLVGLENLGNTCFMNSALQCLSNLQPLTDYFLNNLHATELNRENPLGSKGRIADVFAKLINEIWTEELQYTSPSDLVEIIGDVCPQFGSGTQEDVQEFLAYLLDIIHEDLNRVTKKPYVEDIECTDKDDMELAAAKSWRNYLMRNKSVIVDLFQGQLRSSLKCLSCKHSLIKFEPFMYLSVPVPETDKKLSLLECIKEFSKEEKLEKEEKWNCPKCQGSRESMKKIELWKLPNILVVHMKRFKFTRENRGKIRTLVDFPIVDLDFSKLVSSVQREKPVYDLFAVSNHNGNLGGGHYTTIAKNRDENWYVFNDRNVTKVENLLQELVTPDAYVLFYSKTSVDDFKRQTISSPEFWPHVLRKQSKVGKPDSAKDRDDFRSMGSSMERKELRVNGNYSSLQKSQRTQRSKADNDEVLHSASNITNQNLLDSMDTNQFMANAGGNSKNTKTDKNLLSNASFVESMDLAEMSPGFERTPQMKQKGGKPPFAPGETTSVKASKSINDVRLPPVQARGASGRPLVDDILNSSKNKVIEEADPLIEAGSTAHVNSRARGFGDHLKQQYSTFLRAKYDIHVTQRADYSLCVSCILNQLLIQFQLSILLSSLVSLDLVIYVFL
eukprot:TRINITY_DN1912_c0_g1_i1.p1 TRINITY_DN1912_c0_g1~~TRINITY_DN1912_c0_g1_i1.p1  ORF type:complete len:709 (+),score=58.16 TRINITY_DN1912_c0_g1_i1:49-2175(+)